MSGTTATPAKPPLPVQRPRFPAGTAVGGRKVGGQFMSDSIVAAAREGMVAQEDLDKAQKTIQEQQQQIDKVQKDLQDQQQQIDQAQKEIQDQRVSQPSRMQRLAGAASRTVAPLRALGTMGIIRSINRAATNDRSMVNFDLMDARRVADATGFGAFGGARGGVVGGGVGAGAERVLFNISRDMSAARGSLSRIEATVSKIAGDTPTIGGTAPRSGSQEEGGGGGIAGLIGGMLGGLGGMFGRGGGGGLGGAIRRLISVVARTIFTKIPIIGPLILVALNIEGAMEEYERNGLGAAVTELLAGIGSDLTFGIISKDSIKEFINEGVGKVREWWNTAKTEFNNIVNAVFENVKNFYNTVKETISGVVDSIPGIRQIRGMIRRILGLPEEGAPTEPDIPTQPDATILRSSYSNENREEYDRVVRGSLTTAAPNETDAQRRERESMLEMLNQAEQITPSGEEIQVPQAVRQFISRTRNIPDLERIDQRMADVADPYGMMAESSLAQQGRVIRPESQQSSGGGILSSIRNIFTGGRSNTQQAPAQERIRPSRSSFTMGGVSVQHEATPDGRFFISGNQVDEETYRRFLGLVNQSTFNMDESAEEARREQIVNLLTDVQAGRGVVGSQNAPTPTPAAPPPDTRPQAMSTGANQPVNVTVNNVNGGAGQAPAASAQAAGGASNASTGRRTRQPSHPPRIQDVGSAALMGAFPL